MESQLQREEIRTQVLVLGGGAGGVGAAIAAAREGAQTMIVDRQGFLGGNMTIGLPLLAFLDAQGRQVTRGLPQEIVDRLTLLGGSFGHRECPLHNSTTVIDPSLMKIVIFEKIKQYGVQPLLHCEIIGTNVEDGELKSVLLKGKGREIEIFADVFIDATGDGDVAYMAGASFEKGQYANGETQPPTLMFTVGGFDLERFMDFLGEHPEELRHGSSMKIRPGYTAEFLRASENHVFVGLKNTVSRLRQEGKCPISRDTIIYINLPREGYIALNCIRILNFDGTKVEELSRGEIESHLQILPLIDMLREHIPGFEHIYLSSIAPFLGIRETRRIMGKQMIREEAAVNGVIPDDTIALGSYIIDIHSGSGDSTVIRSLAGPYGITYGATIAKDVKRLMLSGRCISVDPVVFGSSRVMPTCMAVGEGVGIGAALAAKQQISPEDVDVRIIRQKLREHGAILSLEDVGEASGPTSL
ncbi:FAD-dependent oxidoreductase [Paenibacillus sp. VMFN-D1]|uniref:FAD-dependent oxidoreductase n=1 Tax=Paenibacillus sp. VMFN-D1 TaxID=2135608 RepID=UPI000E22408A|nr:FAD-dependent oxidoreductase [Paenibacillus sp. VMFN-D1]RED28649.1 FAD dependent oxidoreductase [Paenibacillus sp. VMFN-D1]